MRDRSMPETRCRSQQIINFVGFSKYSSLEETVHLSANSRPRNGKHRRKFSSSSSVSSESSSLDKPLHGLELPTFVKASSLTHKTEVTTLDNGLRVASENKFGHFCTVGVLIDSGSRYEVNFPSGISHFLEKLAFSSTSKYKDRDEIFNILAKYGGICDCQSSRDTLIYAASLEPSGLRDSIDIMSDVVLRSNISQEELQGAVQAVAYDLEAMHMNPDPEMLLMEHIHKASFRDNTLGLPKFCPEENIGAIDKSQLHTYMKNFHTPSRMVIAGVGVPHDELVDLVQELFVEKKKPIWEEDAQLINPRKEADLSISQYTGGKVLVEKDLSSVSLGPNPMPELAHLVIGLESCSHRDDDFIAFCVLNMMMGGGGSFSAGGPGKGMFTRLYTYVLNRFHWIHSATAFNHAYEDGGVFCIHASADPKQLGSLTEVIVGELINTSRNIRNDELERAKTQLQSMLLMNLENRPVMFEDVGRQVLSRGSRRQPEYYFDEIGKITMDDVYRVVHRMMKSKPAIVGYGTLKNLPTYEKIQDSLLSNDGKSRKKIFNIF